MSLPPRLRLWPTHAELQRMARHPAAYAPTAAEVLTPGPVPPPVVTMGVEERKLMAAVIAAPDDDAPRLAYADWVEATDPERATFIREAVLRRDLRERAGASAPGGRGEDRWAKIFLPFGARDVVFRRGFAEAMSLTGRAFISLGAALFALTPLREVRLIAVNFLLPELLACPLLAKLKVLDLRGNGIDPSVLAGCQWLAGVEVRC